jgi:signal transduction histidine kinase
VAENDQPQAKQSGLHSSIIGQTAGLLLWPLCTVILVVSTLYYERTHDLEDRVAQKELLLLRSAGLVLETSSNRAIADLLDLGMSTPVAHSLTGAAAPGDIELTQVFASFHREHDHFGALHLFTLDGGVPQEITGLVPGPGKETLRLIETLDFREGQVSVNFPPVSRIGLSQSVPVLQIAVVLPYRQGMAPAVLAADFLLTDLLSFITESDQIRGEEFYLVNRGTFTANKAWRTNDASRGETPIFSDTIISAIQNNSEEPLRWDGDHFTLAYLNTASSLHEAGVRSFTSATAGTGVEPAGEGAVLVSRIPAAFFKNQRWEYAQFLIVLAAALLIPSVVVCIFLAKARLRARLEARSRYREQMRHLEELESKVGQRTRELDERNLQLSSEIAERLSAENLLKQSNELLSGMLESLDGIIYVADFDNHEILFANEYLKRLFGFDPVGKKCWQFIHSSQDGPCVFCTNHKLLDPEGEPTGSYQWEYQNPFNKKWYAAKDQAIRWSNGKFVKLEIAVDITEQKRLQHFLKEARRQAELAQGIRSRFVALVAHDLKSPFFSITQMLKRILERETFSHRVHRQFLENFVDNGYRMLQMIDNLLSMDRFESAGVKLDRTFFDGSAMAEEVLQNFSHLAYEKNVNLVNAVPAGTAIFADRYLYFVVLNNLISNGIKFSESGDTIEVFIRESSRPMTISVRDNGKGMSMEYARDLFKADIKTSSRGTQGEQGSGLGLIFCQDILRAHHGNIDVESERGAGTVFHVILPECSPLREPQLDPEPAAIGDLRDSTAG